MSARTGTGEGAHDACVAALPRTGVERQDQRLNIPVRYEADTQPTLPFQAPSVGLT